MSRSTKWYLTMAIRFRREISLLAPYFAIETTHGTLKVHEVHVALAESVSLAIPGIRALLPALVMPCTQCNRLQFNFFSEYG